MRQSWRWFGPTDPISLREIRQAGATEIVTALHQVRCGDLWTAEAIAERRREVAWDAERGRPTGLTWTVAESLPVHPSLKTRTGAWQHHLDVYRESLANLAGQGIQVVCYNFMPLLDWTRTALDRELEDGSRVLDCDLTALAAFDLCLLKREGAEAEYGPDLARAARARFEALDPAGRRRLADSILLGLPGTVDDLSVEAFAEELRSYGRLGEEQLRDNLFAFLRAIMPTCDRLGLRMAIHPDDPPRPILGLPRILSTAEDVQALFEAVPSPNCGLTLCTGSFGARRDNDPAELFERFAPRVHFAHLCNVAFEPDGSEHFHESSHLEGRVDMPRVVGALLAEEDRRRAEGRQDWAIPVRPDHGRLLDCDRERGCYPGYSYAGRLMGLAELRGLELGLRRTLKP